MTLRRVVHADAAALTIASVPWGDLPVPNALELGGQPCSVRAVGRWPSGNPRRLLVSAPVSGAELSLTQADRPAPLNTTTAGLAPFQSSPEPLYLWESPYLRLSMPSGSVDMALGIQVDGTTHWWESVGMTREDRPGVTTYELRGAIPRIRQSTQDFLGSDYASDLLHVHNWLYGHLRVVVHHDLLAEVTIRFVNSAYVDPGADLPSVRPVVAIKGEGLAPEGWGLVDGRFRVDLSGAQPYFAGTSADPLLTAEPEGWLWTPFPPPELFGGSCPAAKHGDPFILHASDQTFPRGMARSVELTIGPAGATGVERHVASGASYAENAELWPEQRLPGRGYQTEIEAARDYFAISTQRIGFEAGSIARYVPGVAGPAFPTGVEPGWEGEVAYSLFLDAWHSGNATSYELAMLNGRYFADVVVDHSTGLVRMHGYPPPAVSLPMTRPLGTTAMWLETGDPWYLAVARRMVDAAWATHSNAWPRPTVGRDDCFGRGAVLLYRYTADTHYRDMAAQLSHHVALTQRPNGSFGDQGGGAGIHGWGSYVTKPWMGCLALGVVIDLLEVEPWHEDLQRVVLGFGDWLLAERTSYGQGRGWGYQHDYNGHRRHLNLATGAQVPLPSQGANWHHETLARVLWLCTQWTGDPEYFEAWGESRRELARSREGGPYVVFDHEANAILQFLPWLAAMQSWEEQAADHSG